MRRSQLLAVTILALAGLLKSAAPVLADSLPLAAPASAPASTPQGYRPIAGQGWTFAVPPDWQTTQITPPTVGAIAIPAQLSDSQGQILVNLAMQPLEGEVANYIPQSLAGMTNFGITIHAQRQVTSGAAAGVEVESTFPSTPPARVWQRILASDNTGYVLTCGTLETNAEAARTTCATILNTFEISL